MTNTLGDTSTESFWQPTQLVSTLLSRGARDVVRHWVSQKRFLDDNNQPRSLNVGSPEDADFNNLIRLVSPHLAPAVICNELLRKGIVEKHDNGSLLLRRSAYVTGVAVVEEGFFVPEERLVAGVNNRRRRNDSI
jgi:hypothetical protein